MIRSSQLSMRKSCSTEAGQLQDTCTFHKRIPTDLPIPTVQYQPGMLNAPAAQPCTYPSTSVDIIGIAHETFHSKLSRSCNPPDRGAG
jgi:hypothetical protein